MYKERTTSIKLINYVVQITSASVTVAGLQVCWWADLLLVRVNGQRLSKFHEM
jgi:hypothetical protein